MDKFDYFDRIEAFLEGDGSLEKREAFNKALAEDQALKQAYDDYLMGKDALGLLVRDEVRERVDAVHKPHPIIVPMYKTFRKRLVRFAGVAAVGLVLMISYANFQFTDQQLIFAELEVPIKNETRSENNTGLLSMALDEYHAGNYDKSNQLLENSENSEIGLSEDAQTLIGVNYLHLDQADKAISIFKNGSGERDQLHLALSYLKSGDEIRCQEVLLKILENPDHGYHSEAKQLNKKLNGFWSKLVF